MVDEQFTQWLLESEIPSLRYLTRKNLQKLDQNDPLVIEDLRLMESSGPIPAILAGQASEGNWEGERTYYSPKYTSTHWSMLLLHELGLDSGHGDFRNGIDHMLAVTRNKLLEELDSKGHGWSCFWGNLLRYANPKTLDNPDRLLPIIEYLSDEALTTEWKCAWNDGLPCAWGAARTLWALAALPPKLHTERVDSGIRAGIGFLLEDYELHNANYPTSGRTHSIWSRINFPLFYQTDTLFVLRILAELKQLSHPGAESALAWLIGKRNKLGKWRGSSPYRQRTWQNFADKEETDRWVSYFAASILSRYEQ